MIITTLSSADPGLPMDWAMESRPQAARNAFAVYSVDSTDRRNTSILEVE